METRSLLRQIIGHSMPFGVLILLTVAAHVDGQVSATSDTQPVGSTSFTPTPGLTSERVGTELATSPSPAKPSALPLSQSTAAAKKLSLKAATTETALQDSSTDEHETITNNISGTHPSTGPAISLTTETVVVGQKIAISPTTEAAVVGQKFAISPTTEAAVVGQKFAIGPTTEAVVVGQKFAISPTTEAAVVGQKFAISPTTEAAVVGQKFAISPTTEAAVVGQKFAISPTTEAAVVGQKSGTTSGMANPLNTTTAPLKTDVGSSFGLKPRSNPKQTTKGEAQPSPTPEQDVLDDTKTTGNRTHRPAQRPSTTTAVPQTPSTVFGPRASPERKSQTGIIVAAVLCALLLLILLIAVLLCRRKHRSGSTSFSTGWAGQAALPDDSALDRDVEQGAAPAKEEETKRNTLITFSGKRQSRVPSVAMEEIGEKGKSEENQKLLCGDAGGGSSPEASGKANGKLPESTVQSSQEIVFPPPPANQD